MSTAVMQNVSCYRFVDLNKKSLPNLQKDILEKAQSLDLKGTVLLSTEGINLFVSGFEENIQQFWEFLNAMKPFENLEFKLSASGHKPFTRMLVRIKKEIIAMGCDEIKPGKKTAPHLATKELKKWYQEKKDMLVLDVRNDYEISLGAFDQAKDLDIHTFRAFPEKVKQLLKEHKSRPIVTYCTGGIRCEKAAQYMLDEGFEEVYQLEGGILKYFENEGGDHYNGECFVFDKRTAVNAKLEETATKQCYACRAPIAKDYQSEDEICPHCGKNVNGKRFYAHQKKSA